MQTKEEQEAFYKMFDELWGSDPNINLGKDYNLCSELEHLEKTRIIQALEDAKGNQTKAAEILKIGRTNLIAKMKKYNIMYLVS